MLPVRTPKHCGLYLPGHDTHWIQGNRSLRDLDHRPTKGRMIDVADDGILTIEINGREITLWNHDPAYVRDTIDLNGLTISYQAWWGLLRSLGDSGADFCVRLADDEHRPCPEESPIGNPIELLESAGGFSISAGSSEVAVSGKDSDSMNFFGPASSPNHRGV